MKQGSFEELLQNTGSRLQRVATIRFLCIEIIDCNVKKFGYTEHPLITSCFFCRFYTLQAGPSVQSQTLEITFVIDT